MLFSLKMVFWFVLHAFIVMIVSRSTFVIEYIRNTAFSCFLWQYFCAIDTHETNSQMRTYIIAQPKQWLLYAVSFSAHLEGVPNSEKTW